MSERHTPESIDKLVCSYTKWVEHCARNPDADPAEMADASNNLDAAIYDVCCERDELLKAMSDLAALGILFALVQVLTSDSAPRTTINEDER